MKDKELDQHIDDFIQDFRSINEAKVSPTCVECGAERETYCENCLAGLCDDHVDTETYSDVDVCKDEDACAIRCEQNSKNETVN